LGRGRCAVEDLVMFGGVYAGRRVFVTGDTGFKGSRLTQWLLDLRALEAQRDAGTAPCSA